MADAPDHLDRLADLFLTDGADRPYTSGRGPSLRLHRPTVVEVLLIGHLPVRAGLWIPQYAHRIASEQEPVALVRLDDADDAMIDLFGAPQLVTAIARSRGLDEAIRLATPTIKRWLIVPPADVAPDELIDPHVDRLTVLTGADEAAIVGAYTRIKDLHTHSAGEDEVLPELAAAFLGAPAERAAQAAERLERAASLHLGLHITPVATISRMESLDDVYQHRLARSGVIELPAVLDWIHEEAPAPAVTPGAPGAPIEPETQPAIPLVEEETEPVATPVIETMRLRPRIINDPAAAAPEIMTRRAPSDPAPHPFRSARAEPAASTANERAKTEPAAAAPSPPAVVRDPATSLAAFIRGLSSLGIPCPESARVEVASADDGAIHLVAREGDLASLARAEAWAKKNANLLAMAFPNRTIDPAGRVVRHLVTDTPARFADLHDSDYRLHVVAPVEVDGKRGWYSAPLNSPRA